jgi:hypothetical protein
MLDFEEALQQQLKAAGVLATQEGLRPFASRSPSVADGTNMRVDPVERST